MVCKNYSGAKGICTWLSSLGNIQINLYCIHIMRYYPLFDIIWHAPPSKNSDNQEDHMSPLDAGWDSILVFYTWLCLKIGGHKNF